MRTPHKYKSLVFDRANFRTGLTVLVNGSLNPRKTLRPHVAEQAAANIEEYAQQLEQLVTECLSVVKLTNEVLH